MSPYSSASITAIYHTHQAGACNVATQFNRLNRCQGLRSPLVKFECMCVCVCTCLCICEHECISPCVSMCLYDRVDGGGGSTGKRDALSLCVCGWVVCVCCG